MKNYASFGWWSKLLACSLALLLYAFAVPAQVNRASITGTITDPSGSPVAGVKVAARNVNTDVVTTAVSNNDGNYLVPNLPLGTYFVSYSKDGFKLIENPALTLESSQVAGINVQMQLGSISQNITVTAEAPVLDNENAVIGTHITGGVATDLPLSIYAGGRFVENFAVAITPGYSPISSPYGAVINGGQWFTKDYTVDGTSATSSIKGDSLETGPSLEAVAELDAQTSGLDAQSAITSGGVIALSLKSGTNNFHGSLFGYGHNEFLDANTWTNDNEGKPKAEARAWDYGASAGGPIFKDKTFFFGTFERFTYDNFTLGTYSAFVPTSDMLNGNFSALLNTSSLLGTDTHGNPIYAGAIFNPSDPGAVFVGNIIPSTSFSSVSKKIIQIYQQDYAPERAGLNSNNRLTQQNSPGQTPNQAVVKLDHNLTKEDRLSGSWVYNHRPRTLVDSGGVWEQGSTDGGPLADARYQLVRSHEFRVSEAHTFSSNVVNVFNVTYNWYFNQSTPASTGTDWNSQLGFGSTGVQNFPQVSFGGAVNNYGVTSIGNGFEGHSTGATTLTADTVTWTKGRHSMSFGAEFRAYQVNSHSGSGVDSFSFNPQTTDGGYTGQAGFGFASFLLGDVTNASQSTAFDLYGRRKALSLFAQDSWKVTPKLTINAGLRWQYAWRYHEKYGHWANFDLGQIDPNYGYPGKLVFATGGGDSFEKKEYDDNFGPQLGFAYALKPTWVVRGSFGLVFLPTYGPYFSGIPEGFAPGFQGTNIVNTPFNWDSGYPGVFKPGNSNVDPSTLLPLVSVDPHALMGAFTDTFNIGVQHEFNSTTRLEVAYVGNRGHHLPDTALAWNEPSASTFLNAVNANPGINPYNDYVYCANKGDATGFVGISCPFANFYGPALAALAPSPQVANWAAQYYYYYNINYVGLPLGKTSYNSLVVDLRKKSGRDLTLDFNYTLSRQKGNTYTAQQEYNGYYTTVQNFSDINAAANTITSYDQEHVVKGYVTYQLPFGRGKRWLPDSNHFLNALVGGWSLNGIVLYASGQPFQISVNNPYYPLWGNFYPDFNLADAHHTDPHKYNAATAGTTPLYYYNFNVASSPIPQDPTTAAVAFGKGPINSPDLRCPGIANENASVLKYFGFGPENRYQLSLRVEFYNLFNRHAYVINGCGYSSQIGTPTDASTFGQITGVNDTGTPPRSGQFGARFTF
jgi:carboxypeptidase family protein